MDCWAEIVGRKVKVKIAMASKIDDFGSGMVAFLVAPAQETTP